MEKEFIQLITEHKGILHKICDVYFYRNPYKEDYYQEILIRLWKAYPGFKNKSKFSTWLYRVALNASIDIIRKLAIQPKYKEFTKLEYNISESSDTESDRKDLLCIAINGLSHIDKAVIVLYLEDYNCKEIAEIIGITENNVSVKINRIKNNLSKMLQNGKR